MVTFQSFTGTEKALEKCQGLLITPEITSEVTLHFDLAYALLVYN